MSDEVPQEQENQAEETQSNEEPKDFSPGHESKKKKIPWKPAAGFAAVAILFFAVGFFVRGPGQTTGLTISGSPILTSDEAGAKAVDYINKYLLQSGYTASLVNANESNADERQDANDPIAEARDSDEILSVARCHPHRALHSTLRRPPGFVTIRTES